MKVKINKEDYYKLKCEEWFNERNFIVYGMFATDREYIPITFEGIYTKTRTRIMYIDSWKELYERKLEVLHAIITGSYAKSKEKDIEEMKGLYILQGNEFAELDTLQDINNRNLTKKINELIREVNKLKNKE